MLRARREGNGQILFILSGRIEMAEDIKQLEELIALETSGQRLILDLWDVTLVNHEAVEFFAAARPMASSSKTPGPRPEVD